MISDAAQRRVAVTALAIGLALMAAKFIAYGLSGSTAIFADALESLVNIAAGGIALWALILAQRPADESHPYGHGKAEFLSAIAEGSMILLAGGVTAARAAEAVWRGVEVQRLEWGVLLVAGAGAANGLTGAWLVRVGRRGGSMALEADGRHLLTDAYTSAALVVTLGLIWLTGWAWLDPIAAFLMAVFLTVEGSKLIRRASAGLMDETDPDDDALLRATLDRHVGPGGEEPRICSFHALRHRHVGRDHWVDFHCVVPADWNVDRGHQVATALEIELQRCLGAEDASVPGTARATAHVEPCRDAACERCHVK